MAQSPFLADQVEIRGDAATPLGERLIHDDATNGSLRFSDPKIPTGINLTELAGLQQIARTLIVSPSGVGASKDPNGDPITTIQRALDLVPSSSGPFDPWLILVGPGVYIEDLVWTRDHITLRGLGGVTCRQASATSNLRILAGVGSVPARATIKDITFECLEGGMACVDILTSTFATGTINLASNPNIGDILTISGVALTAIAVGSVPNPGEFALGATTTDTASNIVEAVADPLNLLNSVVFPSSSLGVVTIRAFEPGVGGNAIPLVSSVPLVMVLSGPTLAGGLDAATGSTVGSEKISLLRCTLSAQVTPSYQLRAAAINNIEVVDCDAAGSSTGSYFQVQECASLSLVRYTRGVRGELHYDNTSPFLPFQIGSFYNLRSVDFSEAVNSALTGVGEVVALDCRVEGLLSMAGDRSWSWYQSALGIVQIGGASPQVVLSQCSRSTLVGAGLGSLGETKTQGTVPFVLSALESVVFPVPAPNASYQVVLESDLVPAAISDFPYVLNKTILGFDVGYGAPQTTNVQYLVYQDV